MAGMPTTFRKNDGTDTYKNSSFIRFPTAESLGWSRDGYTFVSWNTRADGTGESFAEGSENPPPSKTGYDVYYAIWEVNAPTYLDYDGLSTVRNLIDNLYVRADKFNDDVRDRIDWELDPMDGTIHLCTSIAADETTKTAWEGMTSETIAVSTPDRFAGLALMLYMRVLIDHRANLAWMNGSELEFSTLQVRIDTQTNAVIVYARGRSSMAYGVAGVDTSWTIEALPDDTTYELPPATTSTLGGVKVGNGLSVESDGTLSTLGLTVLEYGKSTWADFQAAYNANKLVYCRYTMSANEVRMAFLAYTFPGKAEFQYYRTVGKKSDTQQGDEVYIYTLTKSKPAWTTTVRQNYTKIVAGTGLTSTYTYSASANAGTLTLKSTPATTSTLGGVKVGTGLSVASDGTLSANGIADGSVTTDKLANYAVTSEKIAQDAVGSWELADDAVYADNILDGAVTIDKIDGNAKRELTSAILYATDATTAQTLTALGFAVTVLTPKDAYSTGPHRNIRSMLCWIDTTSGYLEKAPLGFSGNLQSQTILLWAKGLYSKATGILGVDESWTITALPTDADGVSY